MIYGIKSNTEFRLHVSKISYTEMWFTLGFLNSSQSSVYFIHFHNEALGSPNHDKIMFGCCYDPAHISGWWICSLTMSLVLYRPLKANKIEIIGFANDAGRNWHISVFLPQNILHNYTLLVFCRLFSSRQNVNVISI